MTEPVPADTVPEAVAVVPEHRVKWVDSADVLNRLVQDKVMDINPQWITLASLATR